MVINMSKKSGNFFMIVLFIHQNFPGQYKHLAPLLASKGHTCAALTLRVEKQTRWQGVEVIPYRLPKRDTQMVHPWLIDLDSKVTRAEACYSAARGMKEQGFEPDLILAHPGWGEAMFLGDLWPHARIALYCELYHLTDQDHLNFDPEFAKNDLEMQKLRIRLKNLNNHLHFPAAHAGISPTSFQADTFPADFRDKITVCHDGIDTSWVRPSDTARLNIEGAPKLTCEDEVITFVNRNLEPYRGYHVFMRALPELLRARPKARILIVGDDGVSYGAAPPKGQTWKEIFIDEVKDQISESDWARVHFLGRISYGRFLNLLQISSVHVYLTYPFVLSWSLMEAMACGTAIVASDTAPVREMIPDGRFGRLVDFFDRDALVDEVYDLLEDPEARAELGETTRQSMVEHYDLKTVCLPQQLSWVSKVMASA